MDANALYPWWRGSFQSSKMDEMTDFVRHRFFHRYIKKIACTGGGAFKVRKEWPTGWKRVACSMLKSATSVCAAVLPDV